MSRVSGSTSPARPPDAPLGGFGPTAVEQLDNGLTLITAERADAPLVATMLWYHAGAAAEAPGARGAAHLLEHMMFKGSTRFPKGAIDKLTQRQGGRNNAFTSHDATTYQFVLGPDRWRCALEIEADRMRGACLDAGEFEAEREVVIQELLEELDSPWGQLEQELGTALWRRHPYRHPILGWRDDLEAMTPATLRAFYDAHYQPQRATLVLAGCLEAAAAREAVEAAFGALPRGPQAAPPVSAGREPEQRGPRRIELAQPGELTRIELAYRTAPWSAPETPALVVAESLLSGGKSSRLYRRLVEGERLARSVGSYADSKRDDGAFWLWAALVVGADAGRAEAALGEEVARLAAEPPSAEELARVAAQLTTSALLELERAVGWAEALGRHAILGGASAGEPSWPLDGWLEALREVTPAQVSQAVGRFLRPQRCCVVVGHPNAA